jgi:hypothetical protein
MSQSALFLLASDAQSIYTPIKSPTSHVMSVLVFLYVVPREHGPGGSGRGAADRLSPALWHVILAKLPYLTLLPIRCALRTQTAQRFT